MTWDGVERRRGGERGDFWAGTVAQRLDHIEERFDELDRRRGEMHLENVAAIEAIRATLVALQNDLRELKEWRRLVMKVAAVVAAALTVVYHVANLIMSWLVTRR
jgi:hypothetical protein